MKTEIVTITPEIASDMLTKNPHNRAPTNNVIKTYVGEMLAGRWVPNGEPIILSKSGNIMDGQQRLMAVVESGVTIESVVVSGVDERHFGTIDTGKSRTGVDVLTINGVSPEMARTLSTASAHIIAIEKTGMLRASGKNGWLVTPSEKAKFAMEHHRLFELAEMVHSYGRNGRVVLSAGPSTAIWYMGDKKEPSKTAEYFDQLLSGEGIDKTCPAYHLRAKILSDMQRTKRWTHLQKMQAAIRGWLWHIKGNECNHPQNIWHNSAMPTAHLVFFDGKALDPKSD